MVGRRDQRDSESGQPQIARTVLPGVAGLCVSLWGAYPAKPAGWVDQTWHAARVDRVRLDAAEETTD